MDGAMSGKKSRSKGARSERALVNLLREHGLDAVRVPLSGACKGFRADVEIRGKLRISADGDSVTTHELDPPLKIESKVRANGFKQIYNWLDGNDALAIKADGKEWLVVVPLKEWVKLQ